MDASLPTPPPIPSPKTVATPPPLPPSASTAWDQESTEAHLNRPVLDAKGVLASTEGMTIGQVEDDILRGGRFKVFSWNFSVLIMSFKRGALRYVRSDASVGAHAWLWTLPSLFVGWWGIPWGVIFTIMTFWTNASGGKDVTPELLTALVGPDRAHGVLARATPRPADPALWALRIFLLGAPLLIGGLIMVLASTSRR